MAANPQKNSKNLVNDSTMPAAEAGRLSEKEKKQLELQEMMEHENGRRRETWARDVQNIEDR